MYIDHVQLQSLDVTPGTALLYHEREQVLVAALPRPTCYQSATVYEHIRAQARLKNTGKAAGCELLALDAQSVSPPQHVPTTKTENTGSLFTWYSNKKLTVS